jgi:hypothetical protein
LNIGWSAAAARDRELARHLAFEMGRLDQAPRPFERDRARLCGVAPPEVAQRAHGHALVAPLPRERIHAALGGRLVHVAQREIDRGKLAVLRRLLVDGVEPLDKRGAHRGIARKAGELVKIVRVLQRHGHVVSGRRARI